LNDKELEEARARIMSDPITLEDTESKLMLELQAAISEALSYPIESIDDIAARLAKICSDFSLPEIDVEALPLTDEDRANRVFRLALRQKQMITLRIPID
jgi:hypothetical protein